MLFGFISPSATKEKFKALLADADDDKHFFSVNQCTKWPNKLECLSPVNFSRQVEYFWVILKFKWVEHLSAGMNLCRIESGMEWYFTLQVLHSRIGS